MKRLVGTSIACLLVLGTIVGRQTAVAQSPAAAPAWTSPMRVQPIMIPHTDGPTSRYLNFRRADAQLSDGLPANAFISVEGALAKANEPPCPIAPPAPEGWVWTICAPAAKIGVLTRVGPSGQPYKPEYTNELVMLQRLPSQKGFMFRMERGANPDELLFSQASGIIDLTGPSPVVRDAFLERRLYRFSTTAGQFEFVEAEIFRGAIVQDMKANSAGECSTSRGGTLTFNPCVRANGRATIELK